MNETKMMDFVGRAVEDVGAVLNGAMVVIGDKLGLYKAMASAGPVTSAGLADHTGTAEREIIIGAGFTSLERVAEAPFNIVLEAKV